MATWTSELTAAAREALKELLAEAELNPESLNSFLEKARQKLNIPKEKFGRMLRQGSSRNRASLRTIVNGAKRNVSGAVTAEFLLAVVLAVVVAIVFYHGGRVAGEYLREEWDVDGVAADQEALDEVKKLFEDALASGKWQLKSDWTLEQAMTQIFINFKTGATPYFSDLIEAVARMPDGFECPPVSSPEEAAELREYYWNMYQDSLETHGIDDLGTQEYLALFYCYRDASQEN